MVCTIQQVQSDWVIDCLTYLRSHDHMRIEATQAAETVWVERLHSIYDKQLFNRAKSWYNGTNVPGKRAESLNFTGGLQLYIQLCRESAEGGYAGFTLSPGSSDTGSSTVAVAEDKAGTGVGNGKPATKHRRKVSVGGVLGWLTSAGSRRPSD